MKKYALMAAAAALIAALVIAGCSKQGGSSSGSSAKYVAEVDGQSISYEDFTRQLAQEPMISQFAPPVISKMLEDRMLVALADKNGVAPTDEQINQKIDLLKKTADIDAQLKQAGLTIDDIKQQIRFQQAKVNLAEKVCKKKVTDDEVKKMYEQRKSVLYDMPERMRVQMIVFTTQASADKAAKDLAGGATIEKVGEEQTQDHSAVMSQLIPKSGPGLPPDLTKAAFETPTGKTTKAIKISNPMMKQDRWVIMQPSEKLPPVTITLQEAAPVIKSQMYLEQSATDPDFTKLVNDARRDAKVTVGLPQFKQVEKEFHKPPQPNQGMPMMAPPPGAGRPAPKK